MKKLTLACVLAGLCLFVNTAYCQYKGYDLRTINAPLFVGDRIDRDVLIGKCINYTKSTVALSDFKDRLVILCFWFTHCGSCIIEFPKELALQKQMDKNIQLVMVTYEPEETVREFIKGWEQKNKTSFTLPIIVEDTLLKKAFRNLFNPYYVWINPSGGLEAQTSHLFLTVQGATAVLQGIAGETKKEAALVNTQNPIR